MKRVVKILMEREGFSRAEAEGALILNAPVKWCIVQQIPYTGMFYVHT